MIFKPVPDISSERLTPPEPSKYPILMILQKPCSETGLVGQMLQERGYQLDIRCPAIGHGLPKSMENHTAAVIFGGPMSANDDQTLPFIRAELEWIPIVLTARKPFLGICLGAQLLARVLGARVYPHPKGKTEIGYFPIHIMANQMTGQAIRQDTHQTANQTLDPGQMPLPALQQVFHWHREGFERPNGTQLLATGETFPDQAFCYGSNAYGFQFHPEITAGMIDRWTQSAPEMLTLPGAQPRQVQLQKHERYSKNVETWLSQFLTRWLAAHSAFSNNR